MTALSEALVAAQRQAISALSKAYVAGQLDDDPSPAGRVREVLDTFGCTDDVEQTHLLAALDQLRVHGAQAPEPTKPPRDPESDPASPSQLKYLRDLADRSNMVAPDVTLTKAQASKIIEELKAGTYNPDSWTVPF